MKKIILTLMLAIASMGAVSATEKADTMGITDTHITKVIEDKTTNSKGKEVIKYYFIYKNELVSTSKTVVEKYKLAKKYNVHIALAIVKRGSNKRIILN